jgi:2,3,4,5-tetrahydropyridine-2-carboxylate N-succinyltransferase
MADLAGRIQALWDERDDLDIDDPDIREHVHAAIDLLDRGEARVAEVIDGEVVVHEWLKLAILLLFRISRIETVEVGPFEYADKLPLKKGYEAAGVRVVPGGSARWGAHLERGVIMMPSYVNIGARVGANTMVDTWATVGSCAQVGRNVHLSGGVGIGGVLEPPSAAPVMVGDDCLIGSRCVVADGARVGDGVVLGAGCVLTGSIPVIESWTGKEVGRGVVPPWTVAVAATRARTFDGGHEFGLPCVLLVKQLVPGERHDKSALNDVLRDHGATV